MKKFPETNLDQTYSIIMVFINSLLTITQKKGTLSMLITDLVYLYIQYHS